MKWRTPFNHKDFPQFNEINNEPSQTVPDQSMSVREIADRYARGLPIAGVKVPVYHGEENDLPDFAHLDLAEQQELRERARQDVLDKQNDLRKQAAQKAAKKSAQEQSNAAPPSGAQAPEQK